MAIVQISKIIHRTGSASELPQLDIGEIGFASDEQRVFIGNDPAWVPPDGNQPTNTEILTNSPNCKIDFSQVNFSSESLASVYGPAFIASVTTGQTISASTSSITEMGIIYNTVSKNIGNGYDANTGIFTAPKTGFYQINAKCGVGFPFSQDFSGIWGGAAVGIYVNGNPVAAGPFIEALQKVVGSVTVTVIDSSSVNTMLYLTSGDTVQCKLAYATNATFFTTLSTLPNYFQAAWLRP